MVKIVCPTNTNLVKGWDLKKGDWFIKDGELYYVTYRRDAEVIGAVPPNTNTSAPYRYGNIDLLTDLTPVNVEIKVTPKSV